MSHLVINLKRMVGGRVNPIISIIDNNNNSDDDDDDDDDHNNNNNNNNDNNNTWKSRLSECGGSKQQQSRCYGSPWHHQEHGKLHQQNPWQHQHK